VENVEMNWPIPSTSDILLGMKDVTGRQGVNKEVAA
jgi:hypothetical protein